MSQAEIATKIGSELASKLQGISDEKVIKALSIEAWKELKDKIPNPSTFSSRGLSGVRKVIKEAFPDSDSPNPGYYHTTQGKGQVPRYEHLALWYLTANSDRWEITGDKARLAYFEGLPQLLTEQQPEQQQPQTETQTIKLEDMTLQQLELDTETHAIVQDALAHSGMSLADFIKQACKVYGRTLVGKAEQATKTDLSSIPTSELLNPVIPEGKKKSKYATLPGRAEELAKRAIQALMSHNDNATEKNQKWYVSPAAINVLTGSKIPLIKSVFEQYKLMIDDHNIKHQLSPYDHRGTGRDIKTEVSLTGVEAVGLVATVSYPIPTTNQETTVEPIETIVEPAKPTSAKPTLPKATLVKVIPLDTPTLEIYEILKANPGYKVRVKDGRKALTHVLIEGGFQTEETGEITPIDK